MPSPPQNKTIFMGGLGVWWMVSGDRWYGGLVCYAVWLTVSNAGDFDTLGVAKY